MTAGIGLWGGLNCLMGRHVRSRGQARATADGWVSRCARCAIPMVRAHGGGTWEVVKTPMRNKRRKRGGEKPAQTLAKAIARSGKAAQRKQANVEKALAAAAREAAAFHEEDFDAIEDQDAAPPERRRGLFRRKSKAADQPVRRRRKRRFFIFRRKPTPSDAAEDAIDAGGDDPAPNKARRSLLGRNRKRDKAGEPAATPSLAQEAATVAAASKRSPRRNRKRRDMGDAGSEESQSAS